MSVYAPIWLENLNNKNNSLIAMIWGFLKFETGLRFILIILSLRGGYTALNILEQRHAHPWLVLLSLLEINHYMRLN